MRIISASITWYNAYSVINLDKFQFINIQCDKFSRNAEKMSRGAGEHEGIAEW